MPKGTLKFITGTQIDALRTGKVTVEEALKYDTHVKFLNLQYNL